MSAFDGLDPIIKVGLKQPRYLRPVFTRFMKLYRIQALSTVAEFQPLGGEGRHHVNHRSLEDISKRMAGIDIAILATHTENGQIANRPMSNNGDVKYDGTSYYFTFEQARTVSDIQKNPKVALGFTSQGGIFSDAIYVAVEGKAELIRDKAILKSHWTSDLDRWFVNGVDTPNIVLIKVTATRITYWDGDDEGEVVVSAG